jgi:zinc transporter ZupT
MLSTVVKRGPSSSQALSPKITPDDSIIDNLPSLIDSENKKMVCSQSEPEIIPARTAVISIQAAMKLANQVDKDRHLGEHHDNHVHSSEAAMAIWLGILIDGFPESIVIGSLCVQPGGIKLSFIAGVFLANMPEAISSAVSMRQAGMTIRRIMIMWTSVVVITGAGATLAAAVVPEHLNDDWKYGLAGIEGLAGGAMLTVIAETMLPEAFEEGGHYAGFSCLCGFLTTCLVSIVQ